MTEGKTTATATRRKDRTGPPETNIEETDNTNRRYDPPQETPTRTSRYRQTNKKNKQKNPRKHHKKVKE